MYRLYFCFLMILLLTGCAALNSGHFSRTSPAPGEQPDSYQAEKQALFDQSYIDPLTDYLIEYQGDPDRAAILEQVRQERDSRCNSIAARYADEPASRTVLERYNTGYGYSCPQQVAEFATRVDQQTTDSATPSISTRSIVEKPALPEPEQPTADTEAAAANRQKASDQVLSDCYLLTTIRNFSAAREACREPADNGDVRSQTNMATIALAFEDFASAVEWARKAAMASAEAAFLLARMYANGQGVNQSKEQAVYWYAEAARQGHEKAQAALDRHSEEVKEGDI